MPQHSPVSQLSIFVQRWDNKISNLFAYTQTAFCVSVCGGVVKTMKLLAHFHNTSYSHNGFSIFVFCYKTDNAGRYPFTCMVAAFKLYHLLSLRIKWNKNWPQWRHHNCTKTIASMRRRKTERELSTTLFVCVSCIPHCNCMPLFFNSAANTLTRSATKHAVNMNRSKWVASFSGRLDLLNIYFIQFEQKQGTKLKSHCYFLQNSFFPSSASFCFVQSSQFAVKFDSDGFWMCFYVAFFNHDMLYFEFTKIIETRTKRFLVEFNKYWFEYFLCPSFRFDFAPALWYLIELSTKQMTSRAEKDKVTILMNWSFFTVINNTIQSFMRLDHRVNADTEMCSVHWMRSVKWA